MGRRIVPVLVAAAESDRTLRQKIQYYKDVLGVRCRPEEPRREEPGVCEPAPARS
ncbi:hypothetical protein [Sphaerimonospora thailandensis]|uniref:Uncharacterized protein n=1 Tax=Sphaerimonospora thailandensis TaxID=795644 RepID=A0A8J3VYB3_9ACTN|nr:hypothetical protein [Sphaerimonospora thailandensis]GIH69844.1 hypothetical protein Mth01_20970 [Sphaerimonospora thailandensis]